MTEQRLTITHEGRQYLEMTPDDLRAAGVPQEVIDAALNAQVIAAATVRIDAIVDRVFTASASRASRYEAKYQEALRYKQAGYPAQVAAAEYPYLSAEAPARGMTKRQLADAIIAAADAYRQFGALAEAKRAELKQAVPAATDAAAKQAAADAIVAEVAQAAQALKG